MLIYRTSFVFNLLLACKYILIFGGLTFNLLKKRFDVMLFDLYNIKFFL